MKARRQTATPPPAAVDWLNRESNVAKLTAHAGRLLQLQRQLESALPRTLNRFIRVANWRLGKLVLHATNGAVATKLRQFAPGLSEKLRQSGMEINEIEVKVQPSSFHPQATRTELPRILGEQQKQGLTNLATGLPDDSPLRLALQRLIEKS